MTLLHLPFSVALPTLAPAKIPASMQIVKRPLHVRIDGRWYDVTGWADKHPGGRYVLEWADGFDITGAFHTIHLFGGKTASSVLKALPEVAETSLTAGESVPPILPKVDRVPMEAQAPTTMDAFMNVGERVVQLVSPPAYATGDPRALPRPTVPASGLSWQQPVATVAESGLKHDLEALLHRHFASPADYKATPEHWARIGGTFILWLVCLVGWVQASIPATLVLPFAQWLLFSPTVHEASHSTLSTNPAVNKAAALCGLPFIYNPYIWWPQHILSHHQFTNDDALDVDLHHLRPSRLHPGCETDSTASGFNFIFKGYFSTLGMAVLWPIRNLQQKSTGRWYENLITPTPAALEPTEFKLSLLPVGFVLAWPWLLVLSGQVNALEGFLLWLYPWAVTVAIWTVMTQVSHVQEDCQQPPTGAPDDYFRWQVESAVDLPPTSPAPRSAVQESCSFRTLRPGLALGLQSRHPGHAGQFDLAQLVVWAAAAHEAMWQDPIRACGQPTVFGTCSVVLDPKPDGKRLKWWLRRWRYPTSWRPGVSSPRTGVVAV